MNNPTRLKPVRRAAAAETPAPAPAAEPSSPRRLVVPAPLAIRDLGDTHLAITCAFAPTAAPGASVDFAAAPAALSAQYARAAAATREIILFGAMLLSVKRALPSAFHGDASAPSLKSWLAENCPEIPYNTARAYMNLAAGLVATLELSTVQDALPALLTAPEGTLPDELADDRRRIDEALSGKSARQLEFDFGIRRAPSSSHGGAREGAGRPPLLPTDPATGTVAPNGLHRAAAAAWGEIDRLSSRFLAKKFDLALTLAETTVALGNLRALVDALEKHKKELEPKEGKGKR
ncbi:MAG: hypothetical protein IKO01_06985 [Kiritimatiellae bacterium]|nr:hypothetical protein [Kiritimatiellia bacterium]